MDTMKQFNYSLFACIVLLMLAFDEAKSGEPHFKENGHPMDIDVLQGESARFRCQVDGLEIAATYTFIWVFNATSHLTNSQGLVNNPTKHSVTTNSGKTAVSTLSVKDTDKSDHGFYQCLLYKGFTNQLESERRYLTVIPRPSFRQMPSDQNVVGGRKVTLPCRLDNFEESHFYVDWFANEEQISTNYDVIPTSKYYTKTGRGYTIVGDMKGDYDLTVGDFGQTSAGNFQCRVYFNGTGSNILNSTVARITVLYPTDITILFKPSAVTRAQNELPKETQSDQGIYIMAFVLVVLIVVVIALVVVYVLTRRAHQNNNKASQAHVQGKSSEGFRAGSVNFEAGDTLQYEEMLNIARENEELKQSSPEANEAAMHSSPLNSPYELPESNFPATSDVTYAKVCKATSMATTPINNNGLVEEDLDKSAEQGSLHGREELPSRKNVEGLVYADLDLTQGDARKGTSAAPATISGDSTVTYADLQLKG